MDEPSRERVHRLAAAMATTLSVETSLKCIRVSRVSFTETSATILFTWPRVIEGQASGGGSDEVDMMTLIDWWMAATAGGE